MPNFYPQTGPSAPINLLRGWPNPNLLPAKELLVAAGEVLTDSSIYNPALLYGEDEGYAPLREALGKWLSEFYGDAVRDWRKQQEQHGADEKLSIGGDRLTITGGASQSLGCILNAVTDPNVTQRIWVVAPAYFLAFKIFEDAGFAGRLRAVPEMDEADGKSKFSGPDVQWLRRQIQQVDDEHNKKDEQRLKPTPTIKFPKIYKHVIYCVPNFANPSSVTTSVTVREELVKCARDFDALLICDDVYDMLQWPTEASPSTQDNLSKAQMPRIVDIERYLDGGVEGEDFGNVISNASFSKICAPGARTGWVEAAPKLAAAVSQAGTTKSGGAPSQLTSSYIAQLLISGKLTKHITTVLQPAYSRRYHSMTSAIHEHLVPLGFSLPQPSRDVIGGYFLWLKFPAGLERRGKKLVKRAEDEEKCIVAGGELFEVPADELADVTRAKGGVEDAQRTADIARTRFTGYVRLCFSWEEEDRLVEGVRRLAVVAKKMLQDDHEGSDNEDEGYAEVKNKC